MTALAFVAGSLNTKLKIVAALRCLIISNSDAVFAKVNSSIARNNTPTLSQQAKLEASAALDATEEKQNFSLVSFLCSLLQVIHPQSLFCLPSFFT